MNTRSIIYGQPNSPCYLVTVCSSSVARAGEGRHRRTFAPTPRMSSYLVAFVVGNLTSVGQSVPGALDPATSHLIRVWGTPDRCLDGMISLNGMLLSELFPLLCRTAILSRLDSRVAFM